MEVWKKLLRIAKNKYVLVIILLSVWLLTFDKNDLFSQLDRKEQVKKLEKEAEFYREEIRKNREALEDLHNNPVLLEKFAREHYLMKKDGEDIYVFVEDSTSAVSAD